MNCTRNTPLALAGIAIMLVSAAWTQAAFVAYHDLGALGTGQSSGNVTNQGPASATIDLLNFGDGADTGVDFSISGANGTVTGTSSDNRYPNAGTEAAAIFGTSASPIVTHGGSVNEGGNTGSGSTTFTFTGLQAGLRYDVAIYGERNAGNDGVEEFTLQGIGSAENVSSTGAYGGQPYVTRFNTRPNNVNGHIARWTDIDPGGDGTFSIDIDPEVTSASNLAYLTAMRLQTVQGEVIYRETFGNDSGSDQGLDYADWTGYYGSGATLLPSSGNTSGTLVSGTGTPTNAGPVNSDLNSNEPDNGVMDAGFGRLLWPSGGGVSPALVYTDEYPIDRGAYDIESFRWYQATNGGTDSFQVALEIDGQWFVSDTTFVGPNNNSSGTFDDNNAQRMLDFAGAEWRSLSFTADSALGSPGSIVSLPGGDITAFGLYGSYNQTMWFDTYTIVATSTAVIPEPSTFLIWSLGLLGLAWVGRRRKK